MNLPPEAAAMAEPLGAAVHAIRRGTDAADAGVVGGGPMGLMLAWLLIAQGRTNAQIAAELYISIRTVGSHLDRIRDKTGCRRRADLTRLALAAGLV